MVDGGGNGKGKRKLENFSLDPNKSAKTNGPKRMGSVVLMYEKLDTTLEVIISEKKAREVGREERRVERLEIREKRKTKQMINKNASGNDGPPSIPNALAKIYAMPHFNPMHPVFIFACELVEDPKKRMMLFGLPNDDSRAQWLTYLYENFFWARSKHFSAAQTVGPMLSRNQKSRTRALRPPETSHLLLLRCTSFSTLGWPNEKGLPPGEKTTIATSVAHNVEISFAFLNNPDRRLEKVTSLEELFAIVFISSFRRPILLYTPHSMIRNVLRNKDAVYSSPMVII
ncbi:hypothetical protein Cgig2_024198 [Carnegiea gigantea]|uniref:Uncharacterized protein n=1 Tax=Carnegiea gigantea TaxID=171969 RepID=A0A9Q1KIG3_9CARY|nr:hypothetical protein Cgig2_024198 [Carnegiea gigantea]